jgi:two-component system LytT family response regulator
MQKIRTLIVDDEPLAREGLELMARADPEIEIVGLCSDGEQALARIQELRPALVFLDVQMPLLDGFQVLAALPPEHRPRVVFITAYEQHAIRAFEVSAVDYLLKPFSDARFSAALQRAKAAVRQGPSVQLARQVEELLEYVRRFEPAPADAVRVPPARSGEPAERIVLKADGALHFVRAEEVVWLEAQGDFVKVQTIAGKPQMVRDTLQALEAKLDPKQFLRIHRSYVVNLEHVRRVESALYGDYAVYMSDGTKLRLSRNYRTKLKALVSSGPGA